MCQQTYIYHKNSKVAVYLLKAFLNFNPLDGGHYDGAGFIIVNSGIGWKSHLPGYKFAQFLDTDKKLIKSVEDNNSFIAHVRRATIGAVSTKNSHPYSFNNLIGVHNGTFRFFNNKIVEEGNTDSYSFYKLLDREFEKEDDVVKAVNNVINEHVSSASKFSFMFVKKPDKIAYIVKYDKPLYMVYGDNFLIVNTREKSVEAVLSFAGIKYKNIDALKKGIYKVTNNNIEKIGNIEIKTHVYTTYTGTYAGTGKTSYRHRYWSREEDSTIYVTSPSYSTLIFFNLLLKSLFDVVADKGALIINGDKIIRRFFIGKKKKVRHGKSLFKSLFGDLLDLNKEISSKYDYYTRKPIDMEDALKNNKYHYNSWRPVRIYDWVINFGDLTEYTLGRLSNDMKRKVAELVSIVTIITIKYMLSSETIVLKEEIVNSPEKEIFEKVITNFIKLVMNKTNTYSMSKSTKEEIIRNMNFLSENIRFLNKLPKDLSKDSLELAFAFIYSIFWRGI